MCPPVLVDLAVTVDWPPAQPVRLWSLGTADDDDGRVILRYLVSRGGTP